MPIVLKRQIFRDIVASVNHWVTNLSKQEGEHLQNRVNCDKAAPVGCDKFASKLSSILGQVESKMVATSSPMSGESAATQ